MTGSQSDLDSEEFGYNSITGGKGSSQKQRGQVELEITTWQEARVRTQATEIKVTWHHQNPVLPPQQALNLPTHKKSKADLKPHLMMMIEDFNKDINNSLKEI